MRSKPPILPIFLGVLWSAGSLCANDEIGLDWKAVEPLLAAKCYSCHGGEKTKGEIDLKTLAADPKVEEQFELWDRVMETVESGDMPPPKAKPLADGEDAAIMDWVNDALDRLAAANSGDPGPVTMRRLTNSEYDRSIRDLTGHSYGLSAEFQTDGGGGEGFSNTGDVLFLSPAAIDKYFGAARQLADHASILPGTGIKFHETRIGLRGAEQLRAQAQQALYVWYQQTAASHLPKDSDDKHEAEYLVACWKHLHQKTPLAELAKQSDLTLSFLQNWWNLVNSTEPKSRFLDLTRVAWRELPVPDPAAPGVVPESVLARSQEIQDDLRSWNDPKRPGSGVQRRQQDADGIRAYPMTAEVKGQRQVHLCIGDLGDGNKGDIALIKKLDVKLAKGGVNYLDWLNKRLEEGRKQLSATPPPAKPDEVKKRIAELETVKALFGKHPIPGRKMDPHFLAIAAPKVVTLPLPENALSIRAETWLDMENPEVDEATIQWTMTAGKPRDVTTIMPGVLTVWKLKTDIKNRTMADFGVMRQAFPDMFERLLEEVAGNLGRSKPGITVYYFSDEQLGQIIAPKQRNELAAMKKDWKYVSPTKLSPGGGKEYDQALVDHLLQFAAKTWRRPLGVEEITALTALYGDGITKGLDRESAAREVVVRVLVSPHFLFKAETLPLERTSMTGDALPLSSWELASRLSYFLWSSLPDWELRKVAADATLLKPEILATQVQRMLKDPRSSALAEEFAGQWLKFSGFEEHAGIDHKKYPEMSSAIQSDMYREAIEFFTHLFREDRPVMSIVTGETTFLNERLATFYGIPGVIGDEFREVKVREHHRGGLLGMGAILTGTSRPNRTSPVLRGNYLYDVVLGFSSPPPPPNVPELKETSLKPASLREALLQHREDQACAVCHDRIDPLGFALEAFDPLGRFRTTDESGEKIDNTGSLRDGTLLDGFEGIRQYLTANDGKFTGNFSRKLLGYALGRQVLPTDKELIAAMQNRLSKENGKVSAAILEIVQSPQFLKRRNDPVVAALP